jgi:hypothetical protein
MTATRYVNKFGIELEGGWDSPPPDRERLRGDASVINVGGHFYVGECTSLPFDDLSVGLAWIENNYPDKRGQSCGLHVHMSFKPHLKAVSFLADSVEYWEHLHQELSTWGKQRNVKSRLFWGRLRGENDMCSVGRSWHAPHVLKGQSIDRYRAVNFDSLNKHGTVEIRVLPMFQSKQLAVGAVSTVLSATDNYLSQAFRGERAGPVISETGEIDMSPVEIIIPAFDPFGE